MNKILSLCNLISENCTADAFFNYSPHVSGISVTIHLRGYEDPKDDETVESYHIYMDHKDADQKTVELIERLKELI